MLAELHDRIRRRLPGLLPPSGDGETLPCILKAGGDREAGQCTGLLFPHPSTRNPSVVVKLSRSPEQDERILREHENLSRFRRAPSRFLADSTPQPLALETIAGRPALVLLAHPTAMRLKDRGLRSYLSPRKAPGTLARVVRWLDRFAREMNPEFVILDDEAIERRFAAPVRRYLEELRPLPPERAHLAERLEGFGALAGLRIPLVASHGDFCPANILQARGDWIVIDWEGSLEPDLPLRDLFHFLASLDWVRAGRLARGNRGRNFAVAFLGDGPYRAAIDRCIRDAVAALEIPEPCLDSLFLVHWIESALAKVSYLRSLGEDPFAPGAGDHDDILPVTRFRSGSCENVRESLLRSHRLPWRRREVADAT